MAHSRAIDLSDTSDLDSIAPECIEDHTGECQGAVEYRESLSGTGTPIPRCDSHWSKRLDREDDHRAFEAWGRFQMDPLDAGERWDDDY